jgi:hypothetical protein
MLSSPQLINPCYFKSYYLIACKIKHETWEKGEIDKLINNEDRSNQPEVLLQAAGWSPDNILLGV